MRDVNAVFGKYKFKDNTENALNSIISLIRVYQPKMLKFSMIILLVTVVN